MSGFFEFPGGKVKKGEFFIEALSREIFEELNVKLDLSKVRFLKTEIKYKKKKTIKLIFFDCKRWIGKIKNNEHQDIRWIYINEINNFKILESNKEFIRFLKLFYFSNHKLK